VIDSVAAQVRTGQATAKGNAIMAAIQEMQHLIELPSSKKHTLCRPT
jgi:hypothetical protein